MNIPAGWEPLSLILRRGDFYAVVAQPTSRPGIWAWNVYRVEATSGGNFGAKARGRSDSIDTAFEMAEEAMAKLQEAFTGWSETRPAKKKRGNK